MTTMTTVMTMMTVVAVMPAASNHLEGTHHLMILMIEEMTVPDKLTGNIEVSNNRHDCTRWYTHHVSHAIFIRRKHFVRWREVNDFTGRFKMIDVKFSSID